MSGEDGSRPRPVVLVVTGVSGSGKSTVAHELATRLDWPFREGDDLHPAANIAKMSAGHPLDDADRWPWLRAVAAWARERLDAGDSGIVTCSALKRSYRDLIVRAAPGVVFLHLAGDRRTLATRLADRHGHFMPSSLLDSQLADLEPPTGDEPSVTVDVAASPARLAETAIEALGLEHGGRTR